MSPELIDRLHADAADRFPAWRESKVSKMSNLSAADSMGIFAKKSKNAKMATVVTFDFAVEVVEGDHRANR